MPALNRYHKHLHCFPIEPPKFHTPLSRLKVTKRRNRIESQGIAGYLKSSVNFSRILVPRQENTGQRARKAKELVQDRRPFVITGCRRPELPYHNWLYIND